MRDYMKFNILYKNYCFQSFVATEIFLLLYFLIAKYKSIALHTKKTENINQEWYGITGSEQVWK